MQQILSSQLLSALEVAAPGRPAPAENGAKGVDPAICVFVNQLAAAHSAVAGKGPATEGRGAAAPVDGEAEPATGKDDEPTGKILPVADGKQMPTPTLVPMLPPVDVSPIIVPEAIASDPARGAGSASVGQVPSPLVSRFGFAMRPDGADRAGSAVPVAGTLAAQADAPDASGGRIAHVADAQKIPTITASLVRAAATAEPAVAPQSTEKAVAAPPVFEAKTAPIQAIPQIAVSALQSPRAGSPAAPDAAIVPQGPAAASASEDTDASDLSDSGAQGDARPRQSATPIEQPVPQRASTPANPVPAMRPMAHTDMAQVIDRLVEARMAARSGEMNIAVSNADFGKVSVRLESGIAAGAISFSLANADPDFQPAVQAALAHAPAHDRVPAAADASRAETNPHRGEAQSHSQSQSQAHSQAQGQAGGTGQHASQSQGFSDQGRPQPQPQAQRGRATSNTTTADANAASDGSTGSVATRGGIFA